MRNELLNKDVFGVDPFFDDFFNFPVLENKNSRHPVMKTDIEENEDGYKLTVDVPGFKKEDVNLSLDNGYLTISAEINKESNENNKYVRQERYYGAYSRSFYVGDVNEASIDASLVDGVLTIHLPKEKTKQEKKLIEIK